MERTINIELKEYDIADDSDYLYTCAELKAREVEFLDNAKLERMVDSKGTDGFLKVLSETVYGENLNLIDDLKGMDIFILKSYEEITDFLLKRLLEKHAPIIYLLFIEEYVHDFKLALKSFLLNTSFESLFIPLTFSYEFLSEQIKKETFDEEEEGEGLDIFRKAVRELVSIKNELVHDLESKKEDRFNFRKAEIDFEKRFISVMLEEIPKTGSKMLTDYLRYWIDIQNIKNMNRVKYAGDRLKYTDFLYPGGLIDEESFKLLESETPDYFAKALEKSCYNEIVIKGVHSLYSYNTFFSFEKNESIFCLRFFDSIKYSVSNVEKIFAFFLRKKIELTVLNMIYMGIKYHAEKRNIVHKAEFLSES
jgi:vacuolar-type H+-ATPase subunit C/Vma6